MASRNAQDGISLIQTAEGALDETHAILQRMRELAVQAANDTNVDVDRASIQDELNQLIDEIDRIAKTTEFNTQTLFGGVGEGGSFTGGGQTFTFHIGANEGQNVELTIGNMSAEGLSVANLKVEDPRDDGETGGILTQNGADKAITTINTAIEKVSKERSKLGAMQNRLEHTIKNLDNAAENLQAAESRIRDVDMAKEMMEFTKQTILQQASTAMLAQANNVPQTVLQLLR